jgi:hypothetical protein
MYELASLLLGEGEDVEVVRNGEKFTTKEARNVSLAITSPFDRLIRFPGLNQQPWWVSAECMTELLGLNPSLTSMLKLPPKAKEIFGGMTRETGFHQYTYGQRMADKHVIEKTLKKLEEPGSRQALFQIYDNSLDLKEWSIPCTIHHQYFKRNGALDLTVYYRSNDLYRGFRNDVYFSSVMLELMASWSDSSIGELTMFFGSIHAYEEDLALLRSGTAKPPFQNSSGPIAVMNEPIGKFYGELRDQYFHLVKGDRYAHSSIPLIEAWRNAVSRYMIGLPSPPVEEFW